MKRWLPMLLLALTGLAPVTAQTQPMPLSLDEAIDIALKQNVTLRIAQNELDLARAQRTEGIAQFFPTVSLSSNLGRSSGRQFLESEGNVVVQATDFMSGGLNAGMTLFDGFNNIASYRQAQYAAEAQYEAVHRTRQQVIFTVADQYLQVLLDQELLRIAEENLQAQEDLLEEILVLVDLGMRSNADLYQQQAEVARRRVNVIDAENTMQVDASLLVQTLQIDPLADVQFVSPDLEGDPDLSDPGDLETLIQTAFDQRPDYQQGRHTIQAAHEGMRMARSNFWPSISLFGNYGSRYTNAVPEAFNEQFLNRNVQSSFGFSVSIPIFNGLANRTAVVRSRVLHRNAELQWQDLEQTIVVEVKRAVLNVHSALSRVQATDAQVQAALQALDAERERYQLGANTFVELSQANAGYVEAVATHAQARYTLRFQRLILDYFTGLLNAERSF